jgi:hypothetical protein
MIKSTTQGTATISYDNWTASTPTPRVMINSSTHYELSDNVVLIQGRYIVGSSGDKQLMVSIDPATIERKLAIRGLNAQIEGRTLKSKTYFETL